ncbi:CotH kinase family protein [Halalkalibacter sp. AB-rgal2]|uniref:CotH kinase family protein n=1 Tax=Halalkalibacter sp. AB-rgal2 TaxID=3242695 RepID=UPI00359CD1FC
MNQRKTFSLILAMLIIAAIWLGAFQIAPGSILQPSSFEEAIREELQLPQGEIRPNQLETIEALELRNAGISSIEGIEYFTSLKHLDLRDNEIVDLSPLEQLPQLEELNVRGNKIKDIESLSHLPHLIELNIRDNSIYDISPLSSLEHLTDLNARNNHISDLTPLSELSHLTERLYLQGNPIQDFSVIDHYFHLIEDTDFSLDGSIAENEEQVIFSHPNGFYDEELSLELLSPVEELTIYYTLDGSEPDPMNNEQTFEYIEPIQLTNRTGEENSISTIPTNFMNFSDFETDPRLRLWIEPQSNVDKGTVVRAMLVDENGNMSGISTQTYFVGLDYSLPVFSLSTNADHFFSHDTGIYVPGGHFEEGMHNRGNYYQRGVDWERPVHVEYFDVHGENVLSQDAGVRIHGGYTRRFAQKSLRLYSRSDYGTSRFSYSFFADKELDDFNRLLLRNSGNDWGITMFRDGAMQSLVSHLDIDYQSFQPTVLFLNGEYWGIHNIRDRHDAHYLETHYGENREGFTILDGRGTLSDGSADGQKEYEKLIDYVQENDLSEAEHIGFVESQMDIDNYLLYYAIQVYNANSDWPHNNISFWRYENPFNETNDKLDGRWRWFLYDVDRSLGYESVHHNTIEMVTSHLNPRHDEEWPNVLFRALMENEDIKHRFINQVADLLNSAFLPEHVIKTIDELQSTIEPEIANHINRWGIPRSTSEWEDNVDVMREFAHARPDILRQQLVNHFELGSTSTLTISFEHEKGTITVNTLPVPEETQGDEPNSQWDGQYFNDVPIVIKAEAKPGYEFINWSGYDAEESPEITTRLTEDLLIEAIFE